MSSDRPINRWELLIGYLHDIGLAADEIADEFDRMVDRDSRRSNSMFTVSGELLDWGSLYGRRRIEPLIAAATSPATTRPGPRPIVSGEAVRAKVEELRSSGRPHGHRAVAKAMNVHPSTIKRRLAGN